VLALVRAPGPDITPEGCQPEALVVLREQVRPGAAAVLRAVLT